MSSNKLYSNDGLYGTLDYGPPYTIKAIPHCIYIAGGLQKDKKVLIIGAGNGYEVVLMLKQGFKSTYSLDIYNPDVEYLRGHQIQGWAQELPFGDRVFDIVICCETMEHIPEDLTDAVLLEAKRVAKAVYFTIATRDDPPFHSHVCIHSPYWWMKKFEELGFGIVNAQMNPWLLVPMKQQAVLLRYDDGVSVYATSEPREVVYAD
jgi:SAM-dependent methyltransferase